MNGGEKPSAQETPGEPGGKLMQTFRMPRKLVGFLKAEARTAGQDLTAHVIRWLEGIRTHFGLPEAATALLEADRALLGMERFEYILHALYQRSLEIREKGVGFDAPRPGDQRARTTPAPARDRPASFAPSARQPEQRAGPTAVSRSDPRGSTAAPNRHAGETEL